MAEKPLIEKLGIKPSMRCIIMRAPSGYLDLMPRLDAQTELLTRLSGRFDFIQYFAVSEEQLTAVIENLAKHLTPGGMLWVSWTPRTSPKNTGLDENIVRRLGLGAGLVDVKVAALTGDWSGLKFIYRLTGR